MHWKDSLPDSYVKKYGNQPCVNIGTAGHVDHGKTSLIQALTGKWTSCLLYTSDAADEEDSVETSIVVSYDRMCSSLIESLYLTSIVISCSPVSDLSLIHI